jgi:hypothetical protein
MTRAALGALLVPLCLAGCAFRFGGGEHRPDVERLLEDEGGHGNGRASWGIGVSGDAPSPLPTAQDDAPSWRGVATRPVPDVGFDGGAIADAVRQGSLAGVKKAVENGITPGAGTPRVEQGGPDPAGPGPAARDGAALDAAAAAWEAMKAERGIAPVDLRKPKVPGPVAREKTGP